MSGQDVLHYVHLHARVAALHAAARLRVGNVAARDAVHDGGPNVNGLELRDACVPPGRAN